MGKIIEIRIPKGSTKEGVKALLAAELDKHIKTDMVNSLGAVHLHLEDENEQQDPD
ncbi:MAG: hypothetical protein ABSH44_24655 [Bryobacteraceae bacterium]|jgi:hypothetical protein